MSSKHQIHAQPALHEHPNAVAPHTPELVIEPQTGWQGVNWHELWRYRDLLFFLIKRELKIRYAQSVLGIGWAIIQPMVSMLVFTVVFGILIGVSSDGAPYPVFSYAALVPWTFFSSATLASTNSLITSANMISKVYFPRLILPLAAVCSKLIDFSIALVLLFGLIAWYQLVPTIWVLILPLLIVLMIMTTAGIGMWLTALAVQYRDVSYAVNFGIRMLIYAAPVVYPVSLIPEQFRLLYGLNPLAGIIEGFRAALLGTVPMPWDLIGVGGISATLLLLSGVFYFQRVERGFADVA
jgi:lipopolysaccharide transport system permease protein